MKILLLDSSLHKKDHFSSGNEELDNYIKRYASQDIKRNLTKVFIAHHKDNPDIIGYYTLSPFSFCKENLFQDVQKKLPSYPIPAVLIGRLAVSKQDQNKGVGSALLMDAFTKIHQASETVFGIYAVVVDAIDENAREFYKRFGFISFRDNSFKLFLPLKTIQNAIKMLNNNEETTHENVLYNAQ